MMDLGLGVGLATVPVPVPVRFADFLDSGRKVCINLIQMALVNKVTLLWR